MAKNEMKTAKDNVKLSANGSTLTITVDLTKNFGPSKSGKTLIIASTEGFMAVPVGGGISVGLNVIRKP